MWRSNRGFEVCHVCGYGNNESRKLFCSMQKHEVGMINDSTPINVISYTPMSDKVMRREIANFINRISPRTVKLERKRFNCIT